MKAKAAKNSGHTLTLKQDSPNKSRGELIAELALSGASNSAMLIADFSKYTYGEDLALMECVAVLTDKASAVHGGDLKGIETVLLGQALALDSIFTTMARRAHLNLGEYLNAADRYMRLALKAQGQCRATLETLAAIKNPRIQTVFASQANITQGPQQVNNTVGGADNSGTPNERNSNSVQNELNQHEPNKLDAGTTGTTSGTHQTMATVGAINRAANK